MSGFSTPAASKISIILSEITDLEIICLIAESNSSEVFVKEAEELSMTYSAP